MLQSSRRPANPRARKRLSMRRQDTAKSNNSIGGEQRENLPPPDPATLKKIYSSCIDLFQAQVCNFPSLSFVYFLCNVPFNTNFHYYFRKLRLRMLSKFAF